MTEAELKHLVQCAKDCLENMIERAQEDFKLGAEPVELATFCEKQLGSHDFEEYMSGVGL